MNKPRNQFTFYRSYYDAIQALSKRDQSALILAVCAYAIYETPPKCLSNAAVTAFNLIKPTLDAGRKKAESGSLGGSSKPQANCKQNASKPQANCKQGETAREKEVEIEKEIEIEFEVDAEGEFPTETTAATADAKQLKRIGGTLGKDVVFLSDEQFDDLLDRLGIDAFNRYVERLSTFIIEKSAYVQNHYETILKWHRQDTAIK